MMLEKRGGIIMSSKEIFHDRKALDNEFEAEANIINGQLTNAREVYLTKLEKLQKECKHIWDNGENALVPLKGINYCAICRKKFKN